jgi:outer membrane protein assembly factor BamB
VNGRTGCVLLALLVGTALAQERGGDTIFQFEDDPHHLARDIERVGTLLDGGDTEDGLALAEKIARSPESREGYISSGDVCMTADRLLRQRILKLGEAAQRAYDAHHESALGALEQAGTRRSLERLLTLYPASARAPGAAVRLAELDVEAGETGRATTLLEDALASTTLGATERARAQVLLPALYALDGRRRDCGEVLSGLEGETETAARRAAAFAAATREEVGPAPVTSALGHAAWSYSAEDWYADGRICVGPQSEPALDAASAYVQDGTRCCALELATGKIRWRTPLGEGDVFRPLQGPFRIELGETTLVCILPTGDLVTVDRTTGEKLNRFTNAQLHAITNAVDGADLKVNAVLTGDVLVAVATIVQEAVFDLESVAFDARSGAVLWRTHLGQMPLDLGAKPLPGLSARGLVYVLPGWGAVLALDPALGSVVWMRRYPSLRTHSRPVPVPGNGRRGARMVALQSFLERKRNFVACVPGALLVAPCDLSAVRALDPRTGALLWETPDRSARPLGVYGEAVVEIDNGGVKVVGKDGSVSKANWLPDQPELAAAIAGNLLFVPWRGSVNVVNLAAEAAPVDSFIPPRGPAHLAALDGRVVAAGEQATVLLGDAEPVGAIAPMDVPMAVRALGDSRLVMRLAAAKELERQGSESLAALGSATFSTDPDVAIHARILRESIARNVRGARFLAALNHVRMFGDRKTFADNLVSPETRTRSDAATELRSYIPARRSDDNPQGAALKPVFEELCLDPDPGVAFTGAYGSLRLGSRVGMPILQKMLASSNASERVRAMDLLKDFGCADDAPLFARGIKDEDPGVRGYAIYGAVRKGDARMVEPLLEEALSNSASKGELLSELKQLATVSDPALRGPLLKRLLRDDEPATRIDVVNMLGGVVAKGPNDKGPRLTDVARQALTDALSDKDRGVHDMASVRLCQALATDEAPDLPPGGMEKLFAVCLARNSLPPFGPAHRMLERGKVVRPAAFAKSIAKPDLRVEAVQVLRKSVDVAALDSADIAAIASVVGCDEPVVREKIYETLLHAHGPGRGALVIRGLDDANPVVRARFERSFPASCDAEVALELLAIEPLEKRLTKLLDACEPFVLLLASARALDSKDQLVSERALDRLGRRRDELAKLAAQEQDPAVKAKLEEALKRSGR